MLQISTIVKKTEELFDLFNQHFYDGELARPAITVSPDGGRGAYGCAACRRYGKPSRKCTARSTYAPNISTGP